MPSPLLRSTLVGALGLAIAVTGHTLPASGDEGAPAPEEVADLLTEVVNGSASEVDTGAATEEVAEIITEPEATITVTTEGTAFIEDEWIAPPQSAEGTDGTGAGAAAEASTVEAAEAALSSTFLLHSKPGAPRTVYLDFDGGSLLSTNAWVSWGLTTLVVPRWTMDAYASFSDAEKRIIQEVWARVAEDYAPFDIDVTTEEPVATDLYRSSADDQRYGTRVAFSSGTRIQADICSGGCGGIAWIGTFDSITAGELRSPAWVFPSSLGNRAKSMAEAASHEVGHNLGLSHDGTTASPYYAGTALWGPLMGSPYSSGVSQWSKGSYPSASNTQDDYAVMLANGAGVRADEAGATTSSALPLGQLTSGRGYITSRSDVDWYAVTDCGSSVSVSATPAAVGPNLDIRLELRNASGAVVAADAPATVRTTSGISGLGASLTKAVPPGGPYYVAVSGVGAGAGGAGTWSNGYDDYGSLGAYTLGLSGCSSTDGNPIISTTTQQQVRRPGTPAVPRSASGRRGGVRTAKVRWSRPATGGAPITGYRVVAYRLDRRGRVLSRKASAPLSRSARGLNMRLPRGTWVFRVKARNQAGWGPLSRHSRGAVSR